LGQVNKKSVGRRCFTFLILKANPFAFPREKSILPSMAKFRFFNPKSKSTSFLWAKKTPDLRARGGIRKTGHLRSLCSKKELKELLIFGLRGKNNFKTL